MSHSAEHEARRRFLIRVLQLGGMARFVARGETVVVKPNIAWDRSPEQAANANPEIVAEIVRQCRAAGARSVIVTDVSCNDAQTCFERSGIAAAAAAAPTSASTRAWSTWPPSPGRRSPCSTATAS